jgi:2-desacetyl-2-hydroxyethyl bacteriochlorophyllide A dehydrogenase
MRAVVFAGEGRVRVAEVPEPTLLEPTDALVRVTRTSICGSDLHFLHGKAPLDPGTVMGHEAVGRIEAVGDRVARHRPGARVAVSFVIACGACWFCARGQTSLCEDVRHLGAGPFGGDLPGTQAELVRIPSADVNLLRLPGEVDDEAAVFLGDVLTTGIHGAAAAGIGSGDVVAIVGAGPVGLFCAQAARAEGARTVLVIDRDPARLLAVERAGGLAIDAGRQHPVTAVAEATEGRGADVVIEAVGSVDAFELGLDAVRRGGILLVVGVFAGEEVPLQLGAAWARAITIRFAGSTPVHAWWERALAAVVAGRVNPSEVVSHRLALDDAPEGYRLFEAREASKVVLIP